MLVILEDDTLSPCRHLRALYPDDNELTSNHTRPADEVVTAVEVCRCVLISY